MSFVCFSLLPDFNGFQNGQINTITLQTVIRGAVAMECDVLDARPSPKILWFANNDPTPIAEIKHLDRIHYLDGGRFLFIRRLTVKQRMSNYHCEITNAFFTTASVRAPTTYALDGNILSYTMAVYRPADKLNYAVLGEPVTYAYPAAQPDQDGTTSKPIAINCRHDNPNVRISIRNGLFIVIQGLIGDDDTGLTTVHCVVYSGFASLALELRFLVSSKIYK
jgi:hypothetical protein